MTLEVVHTLMEQRERAEAAGKGASPDSAPAETSSG